MDRLGVGVVFVDDGLVFIVLAFVVVFCLGCRDRNGVGEIVLCSAVYVDGDERKSEKGRMNAV